MSKIITNQSQSTALFSGKMRTIITFKYSQPSHRPSSFSLQIPLFLLLGIVIFFAPVVVVAEQVSERLLELYQSTRKIKQLQQYFYKGAVFLYRSQNSSTVLLPQLRQLSAANKGRAKMHWANHVTEFCTQIHSQLQRSLRKEHQQIASKLWNSPWGVRRRLSFELQSFIRYCFPNDFWHLPV